MSAAVASDISGNSNSTEVVVLPTTSCNICSDGSAITLPDKIVQLPGFELVDSCQAIATLTKALLPAESEECALLQSIGTLCGCPKRPDSCELCQGKGPARYASRELGFLADSFNGIVPTCEIVEAGLHSYPRDDAYCSGSQLFIGDYCGCGVTDDDVQPSDDLRCKLCQGREHNIIRNKTIEITNFPFQTCGVFSDAVSTLFVEYEYNCYLAAQTLAVHCGCPSMWGFEPENQCKLCGLDNTSTAPLPDNLVEPGIMLWFGLDASMQPSCRLLADLARSYGITDDSRVAHGFMCSVLQAIGAEFCGCTPKELTCPICTEPIPDDFVDQTIGSVWPFYLFTCSQMEYVVPYLDAAAILPLDRIGHDNWDLDTLVDFNCNVWKYSGFICGCNNDIFSYWGSETLSQQSAAVWFQRVSAILSFLGSVSIIIDIVRQRLARKLKSQIMLGLSFFDIISSIGWGIGPMATDKGFFELYLSLDPAWLGREESKFYGSVGTEASCLAQGFILHWGFTSILFNMCLVYFYKLMLVNNMREEQVTRSLRLCMLCVPILIGSTVAILSMQYIVSTPIGCTFGSFSTDGGWAKVLCLFYVPYGPAFAYIPYTTYSIYMHVRSHTTGSTSNINRERSQRLSNPPSTEESSGGHSSAISSRFAGRRSWAFWRASTQSGQNEPSLERKVYCEAFLYTIAFFASYTVFLFVFAIDGLQEDVYGVLVLASILTPLQGFFNSINYFRNTLRKMCRQCFQKLVAHRERAFRLFPSIANHNSNPSAMQALQGDYGLSDLPSISEVRSSCIKSATRSVRSADMPSIPQAVDEEEYEESEHLSTSTSPTPQVSNGEQTSEDCTSELSSIATPSK